jgi:hypothetical protein
LAKLGRVKEVQVLWACGWLNKCATSKEMTFGALASGLAISGHL